MFKLRIRDQFVQDWRDCINSMPKLDYYCRYKTEYCFEPYLDIIRNDQLRKLLTCMRLSSHCLEIEIGRYNNVDRQNRVCKLCSQNMVESEFHFMLCCPLYKFIRSKYLGRCSWPTTQKFNMLMSIKNRKCLLNIARFVKEALCLRKNTLGN